MKEAMSREEFEARCSHMRSCGFLHLCEKFLVHDAALRAALAAAEARVRHLEQQYEVQQNEHIRYKLECHDLQKQVANAEARVKDLEEALATQGRNAAQAAKDYAAKLAQAERERDEAHRKNGDMVTAALEMFAELAKRDATIARMTQERDGWKDIIVAERHGRLEATQREQRVREALERISKDTVLTRQSVDYYKRIIGVWVNWIEEALRDTSRQSPSPQGGDAPHRER